MPKLQQQNIPLVDKVNIAKGAARDKKFIDPDQLGKEMLGYDTEYYQRAADRFKQQYPDLVAGRNALLAGAEAPLTGGGDPYAQGALSGAGLGDVNLGKDLEHIAINTGQPIAAAENRGRSYFADLLNGPLNNRLNLEKHQLGLSGVDLANVALTNANMARMTSDAKAQNAINAGLASAQNQAQTGAAIASGLGSIASSFLKNPTYGIGGSAYSSAITPQFYGNGGSNYFSGPFGGVGSPQGSDLEITSTPSGFAPASSGSSGGGINW